MNFDTLVVPPDLEYTASVLLKTTASPGTDFNDINVLSGRLKIVVWDFN